SWSPTISRHRPTTPPRLTGAVQPRSVRIWATIGPSICGSRREGPEPLPTSPKPGPGRKRRLPGTGRPAALRRSPFAAAAARARARAWLAAEDVASSSGSCGFSSLTGDLALGDGEARPAQGLGDVLGDGRRDEDLLGTTHHGGQPLAPTDVELGEDVVEDEDGSAVVVVREHVEGGEPEGQGVGPRLPVAGVALGGEPAEGEDEVVPVRADEAHAAVDLLAPDPGHRLDEPL